MALSGFLGATESQSPVAEPDTRLRLMEEQQSSKAAQLKPQEKEKPEQIYDRVINTAILRRLLGNENGIGIQFGTLFPGAGFSLGPDYKIRGLLNENLNLQFAAIGSMKQYYELRAGASFRHLASDRLTLDLNTRRMDAPQVHYYGPGNNSDNDSKTNYRLEAGLVDSSLAAVPFRRILRLGVAGGYAWINVGPGTAGNIPSTETVFSPSQAPGLDWQTNYLHVGPFIEADWRDQPGDPHAGGSVGIKHEWHLDRAAGAFSFRRVQAYIEQYFPLLNQKRVLAFRARSTWNYTQSGHVVPYYMQATLGGPNDVRGYSQFRFYDNNSLVLNAEYRRELGMPIDLVLFTDWGKVFRKPGALALSELHGSGGIGFRFKTRSSVVMRIDVGASPEGVRFWWSFSDIFRGFLHNLY
jgi:outer membrane protein assembly factor BamA